jgi:hypothetical protein
MKTDKLTYVRDENDVCLLSIYFLMLRYPSLKTFITESVRNQDEEVMIDFIFALETDELRPN